MFLTHALRAIYRAAVTTGDSLWKYVSLLISGTPPAVTFISDASTSGNVLTLNGDTRPSNFNPYTPGYYSNYFDTNGSYLTAPANAAFTLGTNNHTIECWYYAAGSQLVYSVLWAYASGSTNQATNSYYLTLGSGGAALFLGSGGAWGVNIGFTAPTLNAWHHIAAVRNGNVFTIYIDGVSVGSGTYAANITSQASFPFEIGGQITGTGNLGSTAFLGYVSNFKFTNGTAVYTANFTPPTAPLTAITNTSLLTCQSNRLIDTSLNNFVITKNGNTTVSGFTPFTPPTSVNVNTLYSTYFDGTGDYLTAPNNAALDFNTANWTVEFWIRPTSTTDQYVFSKRASTAVFAPVLLGIISSRLYINLSISGSAWVNSGFANGTTPVPVNTWAHIAVVKSGTTVTGYVNGTLDQTWTSVSSLMTNTSALSIGAAAADGSLPVFGLMSNVRVVNGTAVYTAAFTPPTAPLTAITNTSLLTCQDATIKDNSTNAFAITSFGQAQPVAQSPFTQTTTAVTTTYLGSGYFDGTGDYLTGPTSNAGLLMGTGDFTIEYWVYKTTSIAVATVVSFGGSGGNLRLFIDNATPTIWDGATSLGAGNAINLNSWNHIVAQRSGTTLRFYTNGISSATITNSSNFNAGTLGIGGGDANVITGYIADVRIVKGRALYTANFAPPATPLTAVANTSLLTLQTDQPAANKQFVDNSGNNFPITQVGNTTQGTFSPYGSNWSNYFDGTGDYLTAPAGAIPQGTENFTIEFWLYKPTAWNSTDMQFIGPSTSTNNALQFYINTTSSLIQLSAFGVVGVLTYSYASLAINTWYHFALTRSGNTFTLYVNGISVATATSTQSFVAPAGTAIGIAPAVGLAYLGYFSNFRIVRGTAVYTAAFTPPTAPLTAISGTSLLTCQDNRFVDDSPNNFTITRTGDVSVQRFSPFSPVIQTPTTYSTFFDGTGDYLTATGSTAFTLGTGDFTIECWFYTAVGTNNAMFQLSNTAGGFNTSYVNTIAIGLLSGKINLYGVAGTGITSTGSSYATSTWTHVALVRSSGVTKLYINGALDTTVGTAGSITDTTSYTMQYIVVGGYYSTAYLWNGYVSNLRVVKGTAVYTANFTPPTAPLTAITNTSLLTCQSATHRDNSANAFTLTQNGDATPRLFNPFGFTNTTTGTAFTPALYAGSAYFDGTGDYITAPTNTALGFATSNFTTEMWLYPTTFVNYKTLYGNSTSAANATGFHAGLNAAGNIFIYSASAFRVTTTNAMNLNAWNHVAIVRNGTAVNIYVNGVLGGTWTLTTQTFTDNSFIFGAAPGGGSEYYAGYANDLKITKGTALYTGNFVPPLAPVTATTGTTLLLNMDKGAAVDSSRSNDLETVGDAKLRDETPYAGSYYSNFFDGTGDFLAASSSTFSTTGDLTLEGWAYVTSASNYAGIASMRDSTSGNGISLTILNTGYLEWSFGQAAGNFYQSTLCPLNQWFHIALVRSGSSTNNCSCYLNGTRVAQFTSNLEANGAANTFLIGRYYATGTSQYFLNGYVSNLRYVKGTALYSGTTYTVPTSPLTAISGTSLLTCQSKSFVDNSSNAFAITRNGDVAVKSQNPFQKNTYSSMFFDGTGDYLTSPSNPAYVLSAGSDFTIEFWCYPTVLNSANMVLGSNNGANSDYFSINPTSIGLGISAAASGNFPGWNFTFSTNTWRYITLTRASGLLKCYVDGNALTLSTGSATENRQYFQSNVAFLIGIYGGTNPLPFTGYIADLRITRGAARYTANFTPPTAPLPTS